MTKRRWNQLLGFIVAFFITAACLWPTAKRVAVFPAQTEHPRSVSRVTTVEGTVESQAVSAFSPFRSLRSSSNERLFVYPGGQSIGVKLRAGGILVVGYNQVRQEAASISPGEQARIRIGDVIVEMNGKTVSTVESATRLIREAGEHNQDLNVVVQRQSERVRCHVRPVRDVHSNVYRIGLYIRDAAAGVGTLTFYEPKHHVFGALGHVIADGQTGQVLHGSGDIVHSRVTSIERGEEGQPGEKRAAFVDPDQVIGSIHKNTSYGVFGEMKRVPTNGLIRKPIPVAYTDEVHLGPAKILTVIQGQQVQAFDVRIVRLTRQNAPAQKSMVIRVTDANLLQKTGGIVQGMSGSPVIQDGRLVGAVTHVFVNDPAQGYGVYAQWMLNTSGVAVRPLPHVAVTTT